MTCAPGGAADMITLVPTRRANERGSGLEVEMSRDVIHTGISPKKPENGGEKSVLVLPGQPLLQNIWHVCHLGRALKR